MEEDGFEPSKLKATDLQSAPFGHSGTPPNIMRYARHTAGYGAGDGTRTRDLLITNQLLYQLSYKGLCGIDEFRTRDFLRDRQAF